ncbi:MAG: YdcF family protein [Rhodanobacteraceae bacterium]
MIDVLGGISSPLIESGTVGAIGVASLAFRRWRTGIALVVAAAAWAWLCATPAFAFLLWRGLADQYPPRSPAAYPHADAIVLVGGGPMPRPLDKWNAASNPALSTPLGFAVALYRAGKAPLLVATGNYGAPTFRRTMVRQGVPRSALRQEPASRTTHQDAHYAEEALESPNKTILLVATNLHMPRTAASFRRQGFKVIAAPAHHSPRFSRRDPSPWPNRASIAATGACLHEYIGLFYYRLRGWAAR